MRYEHYELRYIILKELEKKPFFADEMRVDKSALIHALRGVKKDGFKVHFVSHHRSENYFIVFRDNQRKKAWNRVLRRFPKIKDRKDYLRNEGKCILNDLLVHSKNGGKEIK